MKHQLEIRHFKYFLAVAEELHFRKAADRLFISQPGLSRQIKQMENELGIILFERNSRKVKLTAAGVFLQEELKSHLQNLDNILNRANHISSGLQGKLKLGYVGSAMHGIIPELLPKFKDKYPEVVFSLSEMDNKAQIKSLLDHNLDIGFVRIERVPRNIEIRPIFNDTFSLVLPKNHVLNSSNFKELNQVKDEPFILFEGTYSNSYYEKVMQIFDDSGFIPLVSHYTVNASSIYRLVENNFGLSIVPTSLKRGYDMDIKFIELKNITQRTTLRIVWNSQNSNPVLTNFLKVNNIL